MNKIFISLCLSTLIWVAPLNQAFSQPGELPPDIRLTEANERVGDNERSSRSRQMFMWRLVEYLDLDDDTAVRFLPVFNKHSKIREELQRRERELSAIIVEKVDAQAQVKDLENLINELSEMKEQIKKAHDSYLSEAGKMLDERQRIKLRIFDEKLKLDLMSRYRRHRTMDAEVPSKPEFDNRWSDGDLDMDKLLDMKEKSLEIRKQYMEKALMDVQKQLKELEEKKKEGKK